MIANKLPITIVLYFLKYLGHYYLLLLLFSFSQAFTFVCDIDSTLSVCAYFFM